MWTQAGGPQSSIMKMIRSPGQRSTTLSAQHTEEISARKAGYYKHWWRSKVALETTAKFPLLSLVEPSEGLLDIPYAWIIHVATKHVRHLTCIRLREYAGDTRMLSQNPVSTGGTSPVLELERKLKSLCCICREARFDSQQQQGSSQLSGSSGS